MPADFTLLAPSGFKDELDKIANAVTSTDVTTIVELTQAAYDALDPADADTLYIVVG